MTACPNLIFTLVVLFRVYLSWQFSIFVNNASAGLDEISFKNKVINSCIDKFVPSHLFVPVAEKQPDLYFILLKKIYIGVLS